MRVLLFLSTLILAVVSQPYEGFPFAEQLPPVARVNTSFTFQFSNETYISTLGEDITYSAEGLPSWLSLDADARQLSGTPTEEDVSGSVEFVLVGTDSESELRETQILIVSDEEGPVPSTEFTVLSQLADFGQTNGLNALVLSPGQVFNVTFDAKTFTSDDDIVAYYGTASDRTPLPPWLFFDSANLRFSGVAPSVNSEIAPGFAYTFNFIATDFAGYTGSYVDFNIIVGYHELTTNLKSTIHINATSGDTINFEVPLESVFQDGEPVSVDQISSSQLQGNPDWLTLDNYTLTGVVPDDYQSEGVFNLTIYDQYSNSVTLSFDLESIDSLFAVDSFRSANATREEYFQYYFLPTDFTDYSSTNVSIDFDSNGDWLEFHDSNLTINGYTPDDFDETSITVKVSSDTTEDELTFKVYGVDNLEENSSSSASSASSTSSASHSSSSASSTASLSSSNNEPTATSGTQIQSKSTTGTNKALAIGLGVGIPLFFIIVAVILLLCCLKRRKNKKSNDKEATSSPKISKPILGNPANGQHNIISPNAFDDSSVETSFENEKLGGENEPKRLGALNVLKLDEKDYYSNDEQSSSSTNVASLGHTVDDSKSSIYQDALQSQSTDLLMKDYGHGNYDFDNYNQQMQQEANQPKKSWRQTIDSKINRESLNSLATVSTNELLSIRLAEDGDIAKDPRKSSLNFRDSAFIGNSTSSILTRDDSGNIQRLDSDGNIVETLKDTRQRASRATNLDILAEEFSPIIHDIAHENSFTSNSSGGEEFYPVSNQNGEIIKWEQQRKVDGEISKEHFMNHENNSKAKLKNFTNKGKADTSNDITQSTYETAEIESI